MIEYGRRARRLPAPPHVVWDDLVELRSEGSRAWFDLLADEARPRILASARPTSVVWSSLWPDRSQDRIVFELEADGQDTKLTFILLAHGDPPDDVKTGHIRSRINHLLWADLRFSYGN